MKIDPNKKKHFDSKAMSVWTGEIHNIVTVEHLDFASTGEGFYLIDKKHCYGEVIVCGVQILDEAALFDNIHKHLVTQDDVVDRWGEPKLFSVYDLIWVDKFDNPVPVSCLLPDESSPV